ncbi:DNA primase DnaG [Halobellus litoreus]|uniref:DNA primase DnaG n=1 Tax=Halobellus litoreus TaxID=755310 RepID=A0ABD6DVE9_9EURY|nr:DNA primase DnaG [Halobellus litoreus]
MEDTEKYLIHAAITADGIVERSDVVGAIFGQTEGLLGDDLDLRDLQQSSKVGRIDVEIDSQNGQSFGTVTIASSLDRVKTAILAASLETITRVGPCRATVEVTDIEDVREAKRREVVERAKELLSESFDESVISSTEILEEVKESVRIEDISEYEDLPAGPHVADSDAVVVVEGRADVLTLLSYGIKNAIAVEGTNVPDVVADLTAERTTTAFFDGDRGGELILRELTQVGDVDYVAFAPKGRSVEDLKRHEVFAALRDKEPIESFEGEEAVPNGETTESVADGDHPDPLRGSPTTESAAPQSDGSESQSETERDHVTDSGLPPTGDASAAADSSTTPPACSGGTTARDAADGRAGDDAAPSAGSDDPNASPSDPTETDVDVGTSSVADAEAAEETAAETAEGTPSADVTPDADETDADDGARPGADGESVDAERGADGESDATPDDGSEAAPDGSETDGAEEDGADESAAETERPRSLRDHVREVIDGETGAIRLLDDEFGTLAERPVEDAFDAIAEADPAPYAAVVDGEFTQRLLDVAAQRGVDHAVATSTGEFVKKPIGTRLLTADQLAKSVAS